jgi:hypothetical protein
VTLRIGGTGTLQRRGDAAAVLCAALVIIVPDLLSTSRVPPDLTNHLWVVRVQAQAISQHLAPAYFINASAVGVFYPMFVFYGGTLYAAVGAAVALFGHAQAAYFGATGLAVTSAYGGLVWLSRQLGVRSWRAHAPAIGYVASAYYVSNLYGRGAWPEVIATSMIPLLVASGWRLVSSPRIEPLPAVLLVLATVFFAGSHNVTLVLGSLVLVAGLLLLWLALGGALAPTGALRIAEVSGLIALGIGVDAWFLLPDLLHASQTHIAAASVYPWAETGFLNTPGLLFDPLRAVPIQSTTPALYVQAPDWFLLWVIAAGAALWSRAGRHARRAAGALIVLLAVLLALIMIGPLWDAMPLVVRAAQFPYRVNTYVALCAAGLVLAVLVALERTERGARRRVVSLGLAGAMAISVGLCVWQVVAQPTDLVFYGNLTHAYTAADVTPTTWSAAGDDYADSSRPVVATAPAANVTIAPAQVTSDRETLTVSLPPGRGPFATDIAAGPYLVHLSGGLVAVGRTTSGFVVARRTEGDQGPVTISLAPTGSDLVIGQIISFAAILAGLVLLVRMPLAMLRARARPA